MSQAELEVKHALRKLAAVSLLTLLISAKICAILVIHNPTPPGRDAEVRMTTVILVGSVATYAPMYYSIVAVKGKNAFKVLSCGAMFLHAAEFFALMGSIHNKFLIGFSIFQVALICLLLGLIEEFFLKRAKEEDDEEALELHNGNRGRNFGAAENLDNTESDWVSGSVDGDRHWRNLFFMART